MSHIRAFGAFWWNFVVGDDWRVAVGVAAGLGLSVFLAHLPLRAPWAVDSDLNGVTLAVHACSELQREPAALRVLGRLAALDAHKLHGRRMMHQAPPGRLSSYGWRTCLVRTGGLPRFAQFAAFPSESGTKPMSWLREICFAMTSVPIRLILSDD